MSTTRSTLLSGAALAGAVALSALVYSCRSPQPSLTTGDAANRVYVAPGQHDEFYAFLSGGFNGQVSVYGLPSGQR